MVPSASGFEKHSNWMAWARVHTSSHAQQFRLMFYIPFGQRRQCWLPLPHPPEKKCSTETQRHEKKKAISISEYISSRNQDVRQTRPFTHTHTHTLGIRSSCCLRTSRKCTRLHNNSERHNNKDVEVLGDSHAEAARFHTTSVRHTLRTYTYYFNLIFFHFIFCLVRGAALTHCHAIVAYDTTHSLVHGFVRRLSRLRRAPD